MFVQLFTLWVYRVQYSLLLSCMPFFSCKRDLGSEARFSLQLFQWRTEVFRRAPAWTWPAQETGKECTAEQNWEDYTAEQNWDEYTEEQYWEDIMPEEEVNGESPDDAPFDARQAFRDAFQL